MLFPLLERGRARGLQDDGPLMLYASLCIAIHPEFYQHPALHEPLHGVREGKADFVTAMAGIDDAVWQALRLSDRAATPAGSPAAPR